MSLKRCARCGAKRERNDMASVWNAHDGERWFCHEGSSTGPSCYMLDEMAASGGVSEGEAGAAATNEGDGR